MIQLVTILIFYEKQNYVGSLELLKSVRESANDVAQGNPLVFLVKFPVQDPLPKPIAIYNNDVLLCSGPKGLK